MDLPFQRRQGRRAGSNDVRIDAAEHRDLERPRLQSRPQRLAEAGSGLLQLRVRDRVGTSFHEHEDIVAAILAGDGDRAAERLRQHITVQGERFADLI